MPHLNNFNSSAAPPAGKRRCPICGEPMLLTTIEPAGRAGFDQRLFECPTCDYAETAAVTF